MIRKISLAFILLMSLMLSMCASPQPLNDQTPTAQSNLATVQPSHTPIPQLHQALETPSLSAHATALSSSPVASQASISDPFNPDPATILIDAGITHQTIDGFGATHLSLIYEGMGDVLGPTLRREAIDAVYHQVGINLGNVEGTLLESPGSYDQRTNDNTDPALINSDGFQSFSLDAIDSGLLAQAVPQGFTGYYLNPRINVRWASPWLADIRAADYPSYLNEAAEQVAATGIYWSRQHGSLPSYMMLFNEPLSGNGELVSANTQEVVDLVKAVGAKLEDQGFSGVKFVLPNEETVSNSIGTSTAVLSDPEARKYIGVIGYHTYPYGSTYTSIPAILRTSGAGAPDANAIAERSQLRQLGRQYGLPVWMTEVSHGEIDPLAFDDFRGRAIHIHDELVYADASAYFGMNNMWDTTSQQLHFGNTSLFDYANEGNIVLIDTDKQKVYITGIGYAIGHYARWIKPGSKRVDASSSDPLVQITAFRDPDSSKLTIVVINNSKVPKEIQVAINSASLAGGISAEQSAAGEYWKQLPEFEVSTPSGFTTTLPAESVTTYVLPLIHP